MAKTKIKIEPKLITPQSLFTDLTEDIANIDPIRWVENNIFLEGKPVKIIGTGRDYLYEIYYYLIFGLANPNSIPFLMVKSRKVEMSTTATFCALYMMGSNLYHDIKGLHTFPLIEQANRYATSYFDPFVKTGRRGDLAKKIKEPGGHWSVTHKVFKRNCQLFIEGASEQGDRLRNMILDFSWFDEVQDIYSKARNNIREAMSASRFGPSGTGMEANFGTPKEAGTRFEEMWKDSDQRHYHLKCLHCGHLFIITEDNFIHGYSVECSKCNKLQDKREAVKDGKWIPLRTKGDILYRGYFLNQLLIPIYTKESIIKKKLQYKREPQTYANEVLGHFWSGVTSALTLEDVYRDMVECHGIRASQRVFKNTILPTERFCYMGIDWGGKVEKGISFGQSETIITVISQEPDKKFMIEYIQQIDFRDMTLLLDTVEDIWRRFSVEICIADIGYGHAEIAELQKIYQDKVKSCYFSANIKATYTYRQELLMLTVNRARVIEEVFELIRSQNFIMPYGDPAKVEFALHQCASMTVDSQVYGGAIRKTFKKGSGPNDFLMSLLYAYLAHKFKQTRGFAHSGNPSYGQHGRSFPKPVVARTYR